MGDERRSGRRWLDSLQSLFVDNLSKRLTWLAIKGAFEEYGNVVDVFIPRKVQQDPKREVNFAFVRYRERYELDRALKWGGHQWIDGKRLVVKRAEPMRKGFEDPKNKGSQGKIQKLEIEKQGSERRSYKEVVVGKGVKEKEQWKAKLNEKENVGKSLEEMTDQKVAPKLRKFAVEQEHRNGNQNGRINVERMNAHERPNLVKLGIEHKLKSNDNILVFKDKIPVGDMEWMQRSIMGKLHRHEFPKIVQEELQREGIRVQVRPAGELHVVLVFADEEDKEKILKEHKEGLNEWFDCLYPCSEKNELCSSKVWVRVEGIPLHLWHHSFFQFLGNSWGSFSKVDRQTELKLRFDQALIQVKTTNKANIPLVAKIWSCEKLWKLSVHIVEAPDIEKMVLTEVMMHEAVDSADSVHHFTCEGENRQECGCCNLDTCKLSLARGKGLSRSMDLVRREICEELFLNSNEIDELIKSRLKRQKEGEDSGACLVERETLGMDVDMTGTKGPRGEEIEKVKGSNYSTRSLVCKMGQKELNCLEYETCEGRSNGEGGLGNDNRLDPKRGVGESSTNLSSGNITQMIRVDIGPEMVDKGDGNSSSLEAISRQKTKGIGRRIRERRIKARKEKDFLWEEQSDTEKKKGYDGEGKMKKNNTGFEGLGELIKKRWYEEVDEKIVRSKGAKQSRFKKKGRKFNRGKNRRKDEKIDNKFSSNGDFKNKNEVLMKDVKVDGSIENKLGFTCEEDEDMLLVDMVREAAERAKAKKGIVKGGFK